MRREKSVNRETKMSTSITTTTTPSNTNTGTKKSEELRADKTARYQQLVQKKSALEKKLNEKYEQLHQLCQKVIFLFHEIMKFFKNAKVLLLHRT
jgi:ABC-type Zn2+ transport system substrate-binding protein/surface adhesin